MGRRKIEIKPITHERNRSVTFLKRKNGLFKKAYELGVLCSVQVAVIIFEERPGHHVKLYQYCSNDINDMVQRHLRHDGERDSKGPGDFSGNHSNTFGGMDDDDDDPDDEDEGMPMRKRRLRSTTGPSDLSMDMEMRHLSSRPALSSMTPMQSRPSQGLTTSPTLPDKFHESHSHLTHGTTLPISTDTRPSGAGEPYFRSPGSTAPPFANFYPPSGTTPSQPFIPGSFSRTPSGGGFRPRTGGASASHYEPYQQMIQTPSQQGGTASGLFGFQSQGNSQSGSGSGVWPVHGESTGETRGGGSATPGGTGGNPTEWLDFLSRNPGGNSGGPNSAAASGRSAPGSSAERQRVPERPPSSRRGPDDSDGGRATRNGMGRTEIKTEGRDGV